MTKHKYTDCVKVVKWLVAQKGISTIKHLNCFEVFLQNFFLTLRQFSNSLALKYYGFLFLTVLFGI